MFRNKDASSRVSISCAIVSRHGLEHDEHDIVARPGNKQESFESEYVESCIGDHVVSRTQTDHA